MEIDLDVPKLGERVLAQLDSSSVFGEMSFFHPAPHAATAKCLTAARIMRLPRAQFDALAAENPHLALRITTNAAEILAARLHQTDEWIAETLTRQRGVTRFRVEDATAKMKNGDRLQTPVSRKSST